MIRAAAGVVGLLASVAAVEACEAPAEFTPRGRLESAGVVVLFRTLPPVIALGQHFAIEAVVCGDGTPPALMRVDAQMPEHRHGMNYRPTVSGTPGGPMRADGLLFHMPGRWQLVFELAGGERPLRLTDDLTVR